jgi:ribose-phosphate pyrophosphokinase
MQRNVRILTDTSIRGKLGEVDFKGFFFSGGEPHVEISNPSVLQQSRVIIDARIGDMNDMGMLLAVTDAVKRSQPRQLELLLPYFPGGRQDREEPGYALTAKIYAGLINLQDYDVVAILDPHSPVSPALIERCIIIPHIPLVKEFLPENLTGLICPDAGAERRTLELARAIECPIVVFARKKRDPRTGALSGFSLDTLPEEGTYMVADDLCDGGGTFVGLACEYQKDPKGTGPLHLWVTHGIFSKGLEELCKHYKSIGCSDSFPGAVVCEAQVSDGHVLQVVSIRDYSRIQNPNILRGM